MKKALTFIEAYKASVADIWDIHKYHELLSRRFEEKHLVQFFEGWEYDTECEIFHEFGDTIQTAYTNTSGLGASITFSWDDMTIEVGYASSTEDGTEYDTRVTSISTTSMDTVNDFINDCRRAGLDLVWKEDILKTFSPEKNK